MMEHYKSYTIKLHVVELEPENYHLFVKGKWKGIPINIIIDTGASHTCFDVDFYKTHCAEETTLNNDGLNVGIGTSELKTQLAPMTNLKIGRFNVHDFHVVLLSLEHVNNAYKSVNIPTAQCILGSDFFVAYSAIIDYSLQKMTLFS